MSRHRSWGHSLRRRYGRAGDVPVRVVRIDDKPTGECPFGCGRTAYAYVTSETGPSEGYVDACPAHAVEALVDAGLLSADDAEALRAGRGHARGHGRTRAIRYVVHFNVDRGYWTPSEWRVRREYQIPGYGAPTSENLAKHVAVVEKATLPGGVNEHIGPTKILSARIVDQNTGQTVAEYRRSA